MENTNLIKALKVAVEVMTASENEKFEEYLIEDGLESVLELLK